MYIKATHPFSGSRLWRYYTLPQRLLTPGDLINWRNCDLTTLAEKAEHRIPQGDMWAMHPKLRQLDVKLRSITQEDVEVDLGENEIQIRILDADSWTLVDIIVGYVFLMEIKSFS